MSQEITIQSKPRSVLVDMAERFNMEPKNFELTLKATVVPANISNEQFAAFLLVAKEYNLNPLTKEIYAFPAKGGGVQPIVSIDGWVRIINEHPNFDGAEFKESFIEDEIFSVTCTLYRKDRNKPMVVTEYLSECRGTSDPWKRWPVRMLRHKALIQCARYAFGFSGIIDPDEAERMKDITPTNKDLEVAIRENAREFREREIGLPNKMDEILSPKNDFPIEILHPIGSEAKCQEIIGLIQAAKSDKEADEIYKKNDSHIIVMDNDLKRLIDITLDEIKRKPV